jgi:hypothetical protein
MSTRSLNIRKIHRASGMIIACFILVHLFNHLCSVLSEEQHIQLMKVLRVGYRNIVAETILLSAVIIQVISGFKLFSSTRNIEHTLIDKLQRLTGLYLAFFLLFHTSAVLAGRMVLNLDTNFYFGVAGINTFPFNLFFVPYYSLAIFSFFGHLSAIHSKKMTTDVFGVSPSRQSVLILVVGIVLTPVIFYGLTNHFKGVVIPSEYNVMIGK